MTRVGGSVSIARNGVRNWLGFNALDAVVGSMEISAHPFLTSLSMPMLRQVGGALGIRDNPVLFGAELPALNYAGGMELTNNPRLPACLATELLSHAVGGKSQTGNNEVAICP